MDSNVTRMSQPSMLRSQQSQGLSLSQLSQSSFDDILTNDLVVCNRLCAKHEAVLSIGVFFFLPDQLMILSSFWIFFFVHL